MSHPATSVKEKPLTITQRTAQATTELRHLIERDDVKLLSAALSEVAVEFAKRNTSFVQNIRSVYDELAAGKSSRNSASKKKVPVKLVPIGTASLGPNDATDPYILRKMFGDAQLRDALDSYTLATLKQFADIVMARNPGTKPTNKSKREDVISYILKYVTGG